MHTIIDCLRDHFYHQFSSSVTLSGGTFKGFFLQVRKIDGSTSTVGTFTVDQADTQTMACGGDHSALSHNDNSPKTQAVTTWTPPDEADYQVQIL